MECEQARYQSDEGIQTRPTLKRIEDASFDPKHHLDLYLRANGPGSPAAGPNPPREARRTSGGSTSTTPSTRRRGRHRLTAACTTES